MGNKRLSIGWSVIVYILLISFSPTTGSAALDGGYNVTSELWAKAILQPSSGLVTLVWKQIGTEIMPSGAQVVSGYFYADPNDFAYGSPYNPEVFVKIYVDPGGWANIAFNHVTVDDVTIYSAHQYNGTPDHTGTITLSSRLGEHPYTGVAIDSSLGTSRLATGAYFKPFSSLSGADTDGGTTIDSGLWMKALLQPASGPITLVWRAVGSDTTPAGDRVVSGYFYTDPSDSPYGSQYNPEVFIKIYIASNGWANIASNHVTVDDVTVYSAHNDTNSADNQSTISLDNRLAEHSYDGVEMSSGNQAPIAYGLTRTIDIYTPYIEQQLEAYDADGDTLTYELISDSSGQGYTGAYINPSSGKLYVTISSADLDSIGLSFRVTDSLLYSDPATVSITLAYNSDEDQNTGRNDISPEEYAQFELSTYNSDLLGAVGAEPSVPRAIDLSANFPVPGDQGRQSSCVGWATAYALKSYQEKVEMGWSLNTAAHLFSPAFLYNQINYGQDQGSYIHEALRLVRNTGLATLSEMPYSDTDYLTQPSAAAFAQAANYKAASWARVNDTSQIKAALVNRNPVVIGISVYPQLMSLRGSNSVYNTASGQNQGGHAVTIVGYDDDRYGGAFKVINSWGQSWGDGGYFWMPYSFAAQGILNEAYVLVDAENGQISPQPDDQTEPEPDVNTLPNLTVEYWDASYDPRPRGSGTLTYSVVNSGVGTAYAGADINLMLSKNADIGAYDHYVIYETIPFDLDSGESVYRDSGNAITFQFPDDLAAGRYFMALWVDDLDRVTESNENDNISKADKLVTITNSLPDLNVNTWYADWDQFGNGTLTYEVINSGMSGTTTLDWYINLILDRDQVIGNGNEIFLFYEPTIFYLEPGETIYRDQSIAADFNLYVDYRGFRVPSGTYYLALWVDDLNAEIESNELNNGSYSWGTVTINQSGFLSSNLTNDQAANDDPSDAENCLPGKAYNGRQLPPENVIKRRVIISRAASGAISMSFPDAGKQAMQTGEQPLPLTKTISSSSSAIFPSTNKIAMP